MANWYGSKNVLQGKLLPVSPGDPSSIPFDAQGCPLWAPPHCLIDHCPDGNDDDDSQGN